MEKIKLLTAMAIVGTIGIFVNEIPLSSAVIACARSVLGTAFIAVVMVFSHKKLHWDAIKENGLLLLLSGAALGFNWILLFEAYKYTTVAIATLCYYMAPVFVIILSPVVLKEKLTWRKCICTAGAVFGAVMISGALGGSMQGGRGIFLGLCAATLYCFIILMNKSLHDIEGLERTLCQLGVSAVVMVLYTMMTVDIRALEFTRHSVVLLLVVGIIHTGIVYMFFFSAVGKLPAQTSSVLSYIDPIVAVLLSAVLLHQSMTIMQIMGMVLILGSTLMSELLPEKER
ncbi:MAG: DMT family transporter [Lachnospiraceae bacterium]|jgi:RarD protein